MVIKEFNNLKEMKRYYHKETNSYIFKEDGKYFDLVKFNFDLSVEANIYANDIEARHIICSDINACDIDAWNIAARNIIACNITANDIETENINALDINADKIQANRNIDAWNITTHDLFANDINANDILAHNINAWNINASNIIACDILYWAVCVAIENIKCKSIKGRYRNAKHFVLDGKLEVEENEKED